MGSTAFSPTTPITCSVNSATTSFTPTTICTSSGVYALVGDYKQFMVLAVNGSSNTDFFGWVDQSTAFVGSQNAPVSSDNTSTLAPYGGALFFNVPTAGVTPTSSNWALGLNMKLIGPLDSAMYKSSGGAVCVRKATAASTLALITVIGIS